MSLAGCQIIPIDLNFHLQKCLENFDKNSADKIQSKHNPPSLMPIRDKPSNDLQSIVHAYHNLILYDFYKLFLGQSIAYSLKYQLIK